MTPPHFNFPIRALLHLLLVLQFIALIQGGQARAQSAPPNDCFSLETGCYLDQKGKIVSQEQAYVNLFPKEKPHYLRTGLEISLALLSGVTWYWIDRDRQVADWDFPSLGERFQLDAWIYDANPFSINFIWHSLAGGYYHLVARSNNFGLLASAGWGFAASMAWEFGAEFKESVSINDTVFTTGSGLPIGEYFHWLGRYLSTREAGTLGHKMRWVGAIPYSLHQTIDGTYDPNWVPDIRHRLTLTAGVSSLQRSDGESTLLPSFHARGEIVAMPGYLAPGTFSRKFGEGNFNSVDLRLRFTPSQGQASFRADTLLAGFYGQSISTHGTGSAGVVALAMGVDYWQEGLRGGWQDKIAAAHLPGLAAEWHYLPASNFRVTGTGRFHPDFAGVHALSHAEWREQNPDETTKTALERQSYYFGWGLTARGSLQVSMPRLELGAAFSHSRYDSHEGQDRNQDRITADVDHDDRLTEVSSWVLLSPWKQSFVEARYTHRRRRSSQDGVSASQHIDTLEVSAGVRL